MAAIGLPRSGSRRGLDAVAGARSLDLPLLLTSVALIVVGLVALYSEGIARDGGASFRKQVVNVGVGVLPFALFFGVHPNVWRRCWKAIYGVNALLLVAVLAVGASKKGAERWIPIGPIQFQPSEISKLLVVVTLSAFLAGNYDRIRSPATYALAASHVAIPIGLILLQPHLGAAMVLVVAFLAVCVAGGIPIRLLVATAAVFVVLAGMVAAIPATRKFVLRDYQRKRIEGLATAGGDRRGKNYQTDRAAIAFGSGGVAGTGFRNGQQKAGRFIPEQKTDFVLTVIGEEFGLIGCTLLLGLFGFFFYRCWLAIYAAPNPYHKMLAAGVLAVIAFHTVVNMAMVLQIIPVVGLWLPFISYGGTAMWLCMGAVGLVLNLRRQERAMRY